MVDIIAIKIPSKVEEKLYMKLLAMTSPEKKKKIDRSRFIEDRYRCLLGDLIARYAICKRMNLSNNQLRFSNNPYGKPLLLNSKDIHFNLSHSGDWVVCSVDCFPVGIDVEEIKPIDYDIAKRFFSKEEYHDLMKKNEDKKLTYFYKLWTLKESYIKAVGKGLSIDLSSFTFKISDSNISLRTQNKNERWSFIQDQLDKKHMISVCSTHDQFNSIEQIKLAHLLLVGQL